MSLAVNQRAKYSTIVNEAANILITQESVDEVFRQVDAGKVHFDCVYLTLEPQAEIVAYIIREAAARGLFIFCDAAPHTRPLDTTLLPLVTVVAPNQVETKAMTGITVNNFTDAEHAAEQLKNQGAQQVLITLGDHGSYLTDGEQSHSEKAKAAKAIDEAGAGDAYRAMFVHERIHGAPEVKAMKRATLAGAYAVTHFGSYDSMPTEAQLLQVQSTF